jgi:hypothetical protein
MDLLKTKIFLDKINREYTRMSRDPENIVRMDVDIMMAYVRDLYDALVSDDTNSAPVSSKSKQDTSNEPAAPVAAAPPPPTKPSEAAQAPPPEDKPAPASPPPPVVVEPTKGEEPLPTVQPKTPSAPPISFPAISPDAEALFEYKEAKELSEKLSSQPVPDLLKAIGLNDKLLLTRELFGDDNKVFETVIGTLNGFEAMEQAKNYLLEHCVMRYRWTDKKRIETAKKFIKLVRRRYS